MNKQTLWQENETWRNTRGVSENNRDHGFRAAFLDKSTGRVELARQKNGQPAAMHLISWLPHEWASTVGADGTITSLKDEVIAGFVRDAIFYTRAEAAEL